MEVDNENSGGRESSSKGSKVDSIGTGIDRNSRSLDQTYNSGIECIGLWNQ